MRGTPQSAKAKIMRNRAGTSEAWKCIDYLLRHPNSSYLITEEQSAKNIYQYARNAGIVVERCVCGFADEGWLVRRAK